MAKWLKATLFGRQLSHGSDKDSPENFSEAFQNEDPFNFEQNQIGPYGMLGEEIQQQTSMPTLTPANVGPSAVGPSPGDSQMKAAYTVSM